MKPFSRNKKFAIALIATVCLFALIKFLLFPMFDKIGNQKTSIAFKEQTIKKYLKSIEQQEELKKRLKKLTRENRKTSSGFLKGETPSLAAADLQKIIDGIAEKAGVAIKSVKVMDSAQKEGLTSIPIQIMFTSDLTMLETLINKIEENRKLLTIPELKIRVKNKRKPAGVSVTMKISGFVQKDETEE